MVLGANKRILQQSLNAQGFNLTLKDLSNMLARSKTPDGDNVSKAIEFLINEQSKYEIRSRFQIDSSDVKISAKSDFSIKS